MHTVHNVAQCERVMETGWKNRAVGYTLMNKDSSRSHSIFTINIEIYAVGMGPAGGRGWPRHPEPGFLLLIGGGLTLLEPGEPHKRLGKDALTCLKETDQSRPRVGTCFLDQRPQPQHW